MKKMCSLGYDHNGFVATHVLGYMTYGTTVRLHSVCLGLLMTTYINVCIYMYVYKLYNYVDLLGNVIGKLSHPSSEER